MLKPEDLLRAFWRRKWLVVVPFLVVTLGTVIGAGLLPDRYRSETLILVVPQRVPESYIRTTVTTRIEDRLRSIQQQILSRTKLEQIIIGNELYPDLRKRLPMEDVVERMRSDVSVQIVRGDAFRVAFTSESPKKAMEVARELASLFVNESLQDREALANATTDFLQSQLDEARRRLVDAEGKVAEFQRRYAGALPSEQASNLQLLHNLELQLQTLSDSANRDRDRRLFLERTIADLENDAAAGTAPAGGTPSGDVTAGVAGGTTADQLEVARNALRALELRLKPEHPDVVYLRRVIRDLEAKLAAEPAAKPADGSARASARARPLTTEQALAQRKIQDTRLELANVETQLASKAADEKRLRDQIASLQARVAAAPGVAAEFTALTRDYETIRSGYASLLAKHEDAKAAAALERRQIGEQFRMLDQARLPESPISPNRPLINLVGALAGLGLGLGLVTLLEYRDSSLHSEDDVLSVLAVPALAAIPVIETSIDRARRKRRRLYAAVGTAAALVILTGSAVIAWAIGFDRVMRWLR
jgi:polysaccharide chain length determinant protein (PEP-CTERM system associated)